MAETLPVPGVTPDGEWAPILNAAIENIDARLETEEAATVDHEGRITDLEAVSVPERADVDIPWLKTIATNGLTGGFGVTGDGSTNDTSAISSAMTAAIANPANMWDGYHILYFPAATYRIANLNKSGAACSNIWIIGDGTATIFKRTDGAGNVPFGDWQQPTHTRLSDFALDNNGLTTFGGFKLYRAQGLIIERTHFYDSINAGGVLWGNSTDLYAWLLGKGASVSGDVIFRDNIVEDLQCEFAHVRRLLVENNISLRSPTSVAFGSFALNGGNDIFEDVTYKGNLIIDAFSRGITMMLDHSNTPNAKFRRINIVDNRLEFNRAVPASGAIRIGASNVTWTITGVVFEDIVIEGNRIVYNPISSTLTTAPTIQISFGANNGTSFNRGRISANTIETNRRVNTYAIDTDFTRGTLIDGNVITGIFHGGIRVETAGTTKVTNNQMVFNSDTGGGVDHAINYRGGQTGSLGNNTIAANSYRGSTTDADGLSSVSPDVGDSITAPTRLDVHGDMYGGRKTWDPPDLAAGASQTTTVTANGARIGQFCFTPTFSLALGGTVLTGEITANDTVTVTQTNPTGAPVDLLSGTLRVATMVR